MAFPATPAPDMSVVEAARYALLRRLAPSMRHHLVVNLQPIGMVYEIMDRRLRAPEPNLAEVHDSAQKINGYARAALASCLDVVTWLAPEDGAQTGVPDAVRECVALVGTSFSFRGFALRTEALDLPGQVSRAAFRNVVTGALVHMSDEHTPPAEMVLSARGGAELLITLALRATNGEPGFATAPAYRPLAWSDVQALAAAESVQAERDEAAIRLRFPWAGVNA